ncbi:MAG: radical SAM family heme chaperone HemW [Chloroflexota bacterium]
MRVAPETLGLYVHVPFCRARCRYCDFNSYDEISYFVPAYLSALEGETRLWSPLLTTYSFSTVYIGGGTPTILNSQQLTRLVQVLRESFNVSQEVEITVEANPESISGPVLHSLNSIGVNRLSIGIQSFIDSELKILGRPHTAADALRAYRTARETGFENVNIDLIYGLPYQTLLDWHNTVGQAVSLHPEHLSLYALTLEPQTPLAQTIARGLLPEPDTDLAARMYQLAEGVLADAGYHHYEISNWALTGRECRHNVNYWKNGEYIGLGAGAHSHLMSCRFANVDSPFEYECRLRQHECNPPEGLLKEFLVEMPWQALASSGWPVAAFERLDRATVVSDLLMLGLRLTDGIDMTSLLSHLNRSIELACKDEISRLTADGLIENRGQVIKLSARGRLLSNEVFVRLLRQLEGIR